MTLSRFDPDLTSVRPQKSWTSPFYNLMNGPGLKTLFSILTVLVFYVRLNLINHFVGFIPCQFACNSTLRNPVFRWESCKGNVWESVKKCSRRCTKAGTHDWISRVAHDWQAARGCTRVKHTEKLNCHANCSIIGQRV